MWIDEKGVRHIEDQPPEKPAKMIGKDTFKPDSSEEIRRFQQQQKNYEQDLETRRRYNRQEETSEKRFNANMDRKKEIIKQRAAERKERAIERIDDLNAERELLRARENRDYREVRRLRLKDERRQIDRKIEKYKDIKDQ
jgi:molecular chaperone DnaK (HSP70)